MSIVHLPLPDTMMMLSSDAEVTVFSYGLSAEVSPLTRNDAKCGLGHTRITLSAGTVIAIKSFSVTGIHLRAECFVADSPCLPLTATRMGASLKFPRGALRFWLDGPDINALNAETVESRPWGYYLRVLDKAA